MGGESRASMKAHPSEPSSLVRVSGLQKSRCSGCRKKNPLTESRDFGPIGDIQKKPAISQPGDEFEIEADRIAEAVVNGRPGHVHPMLRAPATIHRADEGKGPKKDEEKQKEALKKTGEALLKTEAGKQIIGIAKSAAKNATAKPAGKVIAGAVAASAVAAIYAANITLPMQLPEIPLDFLYEGMKVKLTYEGPAQSPSAASISITFGERLPSASAPRAEEAGSKTDRSAGSQRSESSFVSPSGDVVDAVGRRLKTPAMMAEEWARENEEMMRNYPSRGPGMLPPQGYQMPRVWPDFRYDPSRPPGGTGLYPGPYTILPEALRAPKIDDQTKRKDEDIAVQRKETDGREMNAVPPSVQEALQSPGRTLDHNNTLWSKIESESLTQDNLEVNSPGDIWEQEADQVAEHVISIIGGNRLLRPAFSTYLPRNRMQMHRKINGEAAGTLQIEPQLKRSRGNGHPLPSETLNFMNRALGADFSPVRVHSDSEAINMNRTLRAHSFTYGEHIYFNSGKYNPFSVEGCRLLAHELTHVVHQRGANSTRFVQGRIIQRSMDTYIKAMAQKPPNYYEAAWHLNGETSWKIREVLGNLSPYIRAQLHQAARNGSGLGKCSEIALSTEPDYLKSHPDEKPTTRQECGKSIPKESPPSTPPGYTVEKYVDNFKEVIYDPDYRLSEGSPTNWMQVNYDDGTSIDINIYSFDEKATARETRDSLANGSLGTGGRFFPRTLNRYTAPRLWAARQDAIEIATKCTNELMKASLPAVMFVLTLPAMPAGNPEGLASPRVARRRVPKGASKASSAPSAFQRIKPVNGVVNVGGGLEQGSSNWTNLQPFKEGSGGPPATSASKIPNLVRGWFEQIGEIFEIGSVKRVQSHRLVFSDVNWPQASKGSYEVMASGGELYLNVWTETIEQAQVIIEEFAKAGFRSVRNIGTAKGNGVIIVGIR